MGMEPPLKAVVSIFTQTHIEIDTSGTLEKNIDIGYIPRA